MSKKKKQKSIKYRDVELNIMPFIDVFSLLNTFLLMSAVFLAIGVIEVQIPFLTNSPETKPTKDTDCAIKVDAMKEKIEASAENCKGVDPKKEFVTNKSGMTPLHKYMVDIRRNNPDFDKVQFFTDDDVIWKDVAMILDAIKLRAPGDPVMPPKSDSPADRAAALEFIFPKVIMSSVMLK